MTPLSISETTPLFTYKVIGHKRQGFLFWLDDIAPRVNLRHNDIALMNGRAMLAMEHPHYGWVFRDVTAQFMEADGAQVDIDETTQAVLESTR